MYAIINYTYNRENGRVSTGYSSLLDCKETVKWVKKFDKQSRFSKREYEELDCNTVEEARQLIEAKGLKLNQFSNSIHTLKDYVVILNYKFKDGKLIECEHNAFVDSDYEIICRARTHADFMITMSLYAYAHIDIDTILSVFDDYASYLEMNLTELALHHILKEICKRATTILKQKVRQLV